MKRWSLTAVLVLALCAPAQAATTVARTGDFAIRAQERAGRLCMTLQRAATTGAGAAGASRGRRSGRS